MKSDCTQTDTIGKAMKTNIAIIDGATNQKNVLFRMGAIAFAE